MRLAAIYGTRTFLVCLATVVAVYPVFQCPLALDEPVMMRRVAIGIAAVTATGAWIGWNRRAQPNLSDEHESRPSSPP